MEFIYLVYLKDKAPLHIRKEDLYTGINGIIHRIDGPAVISIDGYEAWWVEGKLHRLNGPAVNNCGNKEYWINDVELTYSEYKKVRKWMTI